MLIQCDAEQLEWRVLAFLANDAVAIKEINDNIDFHTENQKTFGLPTRLIAKVYLFRTIYRGTGYSFSIDPDFLVISNDPAYWDKINEKFFRKYKGIDKCHNEWANLVAARRPIVSPFGREWLITPVQKTYIDRFTGKEKTVEKLPMPTLTNYPVQGTGNDIMAVARVSLFNRLRKQDLLQYVKLVSTVHDSIVIDCHDDYVQKVANLMYEVFNDLKKNIYKLWSVNSPVDFLCKVKAGPNLLDVKPVPYTGY